MLCVPMARPAVLHVALFELAARPLGHRGTAGKCRADSEAKSTPPVGPLPLIVAVNVTLAPTRDGLTELVSVVALAAGMTTCASGALAEAALLESLL